MSTRVQVILDEQERELFRWYANKEGLSLSAWLLRAGRDKVASLKAKRIRSPQELESFFAECDANERHGGLEPEWDEHLRMLEQSRTSGLPPA